MTDKELVKRMRELRNNQYADPSTAPEFVFLDPDLPPSEWEKQYSMDVVYVRADRIEQLVATNEELCVLHREYEKLLTERIEELQQTLKDQSSVSDRLAEANEKLTAELATCEKYRDAYAECDRIGTEAYRELESKLAKLVKKSNAMLDAFCFHETQQQDEAYDDMYTTLAEIENSEAVTLGETAMTDEVQEAPFHIVVDKVLEHEDGGATYTFDMNHKTTQAMAQYGLELILICAAYGVDIQDAFDSIRNLGTKDA